MEVLIQKRANLNIQDRVCSFATVVNITACMLFYISPTMRFIVFYSLYIHVCMLYYIPPQDGLTALMCATLENHSETVSVLVEYGADLNVQNKVQEYTLL